MSRLIKQVNSLSDGGRVIVYTGLSLFGAISIVLVAVYRSEIWRALQLLFYASLLIGTLGAIGFGLLRVVQANRLKREAAEMAARNAQTQKTQQRAQLLRAISAGQAKPLSHSSGVFLRNSESLWYHSPAQAVGRKDELHTGTLFVTSLRILFVCPEYPLEIPIANVNAAKINSTTLDLIGKTATSTQSFCAQDPELIAAHIDRSVKAFHRQVDVGFEEGAGRHVPQDVKTAVWQRDGGKCVQCGAADYLEFDHIIPYGKGGAGSVDNVQLLCRRCNLKKGAAI
jgi:hypothetical protein